MKRFAAVLLGLLLVLPPARAELISLDTKDAVHERAWLAAEMVKMGVPPKQAVARVDALTDQEVLRLAQRLGETSAGGNDLQAMFMVLLIVVVVIALALM